MAAVLTQDAVLDFIQSSGGSVKNSDLLQHFKNFIRDHADQDRNRELFKKFVNTVATVRQEGGVSHVVLRKQYRGNEGSSKAPKGPEPSPQRTNLTPTASADKSRLKPQPREAEAPAPAGGPATKTILPAAGIMTNNNNNNVGANVTVKQPNSTAQPSGRSPAAQSSGPNTDETQLKTPSLSKSPAQEQQKTGGQARVGLGPLPGIAPVAPAVRHHGQISQLIPDPVVPVPQNLKAREVGLQSEGGLPLEPVPNRVRYGSEVTPIRIRYRPSYKSAMSCDEEEEEEEEELPVRRSSGGAEWPVSGPLRDTVRTMSTSSPCIIDNPPPPPSFSPSDGQTPKIFIQDVELESLASEAGLGPVTLSGGPAPARQSVSMEPSPDPRALGHVQNNPQYSQPAGVQLEPVQGQHRHQTVQLSSGPRIIFPLASGAGFSSRPKPPSGSPRGSGWSSSYEDAQPQTAESGREPQIEDLLQRAQSTPLESTTHAAESKTTASPCHQSAGRLHGNQEAKTYGLHLSSGNLIDNHDESSDGSTSTPRLSRRLSREVRSRLSRSLGNDLDQIVKGKLGGGGSEAARLNRLHLISSSLSLRANLSSSSLSSCSTPPRCQSLVELDEGVEHKESGSSPPATTSSSTTRQDGHAGQVRQPLVPLDAKEHAWYVKAAAGAWPDIYSLFREDPSLLNRQDFISGFSVLHWIAKHGDHRVLNTLWYGMQKQGLTFSVNARSLSGQTPLHIAAIHGRKNIMRLLVKNFSADVKLRDIAGKRPWQYLSSATTPDIFQLLGAPARAAFGAALSLEQQQQQQQQQQQRRRRHHLSSASSGERPSITPGMPKVKRSTSLAAFLKHKSLLPFNGQQSGTAI